MVGREQHRHHDHDGDHEHHGGFEPRGTGMGMSFGVRRGEFRFLVLIALTKKPMHGYALIQAIGRTYQRPVSAGLVYPTLHELEDMEYVTSGEKGGKRVYSITIEGKKYLEENGEIVSRLEAGQEYAGKVGQFSFLRDLRDIQDILMTNAEYVDEAKMTKIQSMLTDTKRKVAAIVFG